MGPTIVKRASILYIIFGVASDVCSPQPYILWKIWRLTFLYFFVFSVLTAKSREKRVDIIYLQYDVWTKIKMSNRNFFFGSFFVCFVLFADDMIYCDFFFTWNDTTIFLDGIHFLNNNKRVSGGAFMND